MHGYNPTYRNDLPTDTDRLLERVREFLGRRGDGLTVDLVGPAGVVADAVDDLSDIAERIAVRLAIVPGLDGGQDLLLLLGEIRQLEHEPSTLGARDIAPGLVIQGCPRRCYRLVDVLRGPGLYRADILFITAADHLR